MFSYEIQPRFSETDGLGHINNAVLPVWLEEARIGIFKIFNPSLAMKTWNLILKKYEVEFVAQIWREYPVTVETRITHVGTSSLVVTQRVVQRGETVAKGTTVLVHFDYAKNAPAPIPPAVRTELEPHRVTAD